MYSYKDGIRAVELYIKLGKRVRPTIRRLGYPTKNSQKGWYREYQQRLDLPVSYARREPTFSQVQKAAAIEHYLTDPTPNLTSAARLCARDVQKKFGGQDEGASVLFGQVLTVFGIVITDVWGATQWTTAALGCGVRFFEGQDQRAPHVDGHTHRRRSVNTRCRPLLLQGFH